MKVATSSLETIAIDYLLIISYDMHVYYKLNYAENLLAETPIHNLMNKA